MSLRTLPFMLVALRFAAGAMGMYLIGTAAQAAENALSYRVLCYHDVQEDVRVNPDPYAVDSAQLVAQFAWMKDNGYRVVSLDDVIAAKEGRRALPEKAVVLTFDDGYRSVYTRVFPLLKLFKYPAIVALSGRWLDAAPGETVEYDGKRVARERFLSWEQIREMADSGLVEIASHTYDLHRGIPANPQGSLVPAVIAYSYDAANNTYEDEPAHLARLRADLARNSKLIESKTGRRPRVMVWPFGRDSMQAIAVAREIGMPVTMSLADGANNLNDDLSRVRRDQLTRNPPLRDFVSMVSKDPDPLPERVAHVDLDYVYDANPRQQQANIDSLLDRMLALRVTTVYLQAFADGDGNGQAEAMYFPNRHMPLRADLFSYVAWQLSSRAFVKVYAWMPVLAFELPSTNSAAMLTVHSADADSASAHPRYRRLSPFSADSQRVIGEIYEDLARHATFDGLLFHDDAVLDDFEDASPSALQAYQEWGLPASVEAIRSDPQLLQHWTELKTRALIEFTGDLAERVRDHRGAIKTARNLYARPVLEPGSEASFAQSLPDFLAAYDYTAVMAMPLMEGAAKPDAWLDALVRKVSAEPGALRKTVFELQSMDWNTRQRVPTRTLAKQMNRLQRLGAINFGYYPDDFLTDHPGLAGIKPAISLQSFPRSD
ncbi:MAG TPA: poly-beta-1,6-N-acetyl-D-glucosamine N-deacetylase PgaB [Burkholderiales bacterium]|nr:poly-beta-1,6-N-acetyl-D-glucosamine N-deacetylase PgaB [Burkholderiales bacterium]